MKHVMICSGGSQWHTGRTRGLTRMSVKDVKNTKTQNIMSENQRINTLQVVERDANAVNKYL